jgi:hypothetical protein
MFDIEPQLPGYEDYGPEPSLRKIIYIRYRQYFNKEESLSLTNKYIIQLMKQYQEGITNAS